MSYLPKVVDKKIDELMKLNGHVFFLSNLLLFCYNFSRIGCARNENKKYYKKYASNRVMSNYDYWLYES